MESLAWHTGEPTPRLPSHLRFRWAPLVAALLIVVSSFDPLQAAPGGLDPAFGKQGRDFGMGAEEIEALELRSDGAIVAAGCAGCEDWLVARFTSTGGLDPSFNGDGWLTIDFAGYGDNARDVAVQADGSIVVVGLAGLGFGQNRRSRRPGRPRWPSRRMAASSPLDPPRPIRHPPGDVLPDRGSRGPRTSGQTERIVGLQPGTRRRSHTDIAVQADGKYVVVGETFAQGEDQDFADMA